jgi:hypothetical protein
MFVFKILILILSLIGYIKFLLNKFNVRFEFCFALYSSLLVTFLFIGSLLKLLLPFSIIFFVCGIILFIYYFIKHKFSFSLKKGNYLCLFSVGLIFLFLVLSLREVKLLHFDNFSHWAIIIRQLLEFNNLPDTSNIMTTFVTYPPGTAYFVYYFCTFFGNSEYFMLVGQALLLLFFCMPIWAFIKNGKLKYFIAFLFTILVLVFNDSVANLLVDTFLGLIGLTSLLIIIYYKDNLKKSLFILVPIHTFLLLTKNIAIFFYFIDIVYVIYLIFKSKNYLFKDKVVSLLVLFIPLILFSFWKVRTKIVFGDYVSLSTQNMSLSYFKNNFYEKGFSDLILIVKGFVKGVFDFSYNECKLFFTLIVMGIIYFIIFKKNNQYKKKIICFFTCVVVVYALYNAGLLFAYIFSMTLDEAIRLACYDRYLSTVVIMLLGLVLALYFYGVDFKHQIIFEILISSVCIIYIIISPGLNEFLGKQNYGTSTRCKIQNAIKGMPISTNLNYLVISNESKVNGYISLIFKYNFMHRNFIVVSDSSTLDKYNILNYDYVITLDSDDYVNEFLSYKTEYDGKTGFYKVEKER